MFKVHGNWQYSIEPPVIFIKLIGCFNREGVMAFATEVQAELAAFAPNTIEFAAINLADFELATADSLAVTKEYFHAVKSRGYKRVDYIQPSLIAKNLLEHIWRGSDMSVHFYPTLQSYIEQYPEFNCANKWL